MASIVNYVADGATNQFQIPFTYINQADVVVTVNGTTPTFTFVNTTTINIASTPVSGAKVIIKRVTPLNALVDFTDGSTLFEADLDLAHQQNRLIAEESRDRADSAINTLNANITNIDAVAGIATNVTTVAGNTTNINSVATNMAEVLTADTNAATATTKANEASASASTASAQATISTTKAGESSTSAAEALASKNAASVSESNASTSETNAANSATASANSALASSSSSTSASGSATTATTKAAESLASANNSAISATNSANSATAAASSATAASASKDAALAALDSFDDRYLGVKSSNPSVDNDGNALVAGSLYFNSTDDTMKVYEGSTWVAAYASLSGAVLQANNLSDLTSATDARANLGLGTAATTAATAYATAAQGTTADNALPKSGGAMTGDLDVTGNIVVSGTVDGVDIAARNGTLTNTTATANAALPKAGGAMTGAITTNSTFDGRDVAADGTKLDGIESGATADQTNAEIRAAVEAASDSNVFTDADHTKLNGIATGANDYVHPTSAGNKHIPSGGSSGQVLGYSSSGTATWTDPAGGASLTFTNAGTWVSSTSFTTFSGGTNGIFFQADGFSSGGNQNANRARQTINANGNGTWFQIDGTNIKKGGENHYIQAGNGGVQYTAFGYVAPGGNLRTILGAGNYSSVNVRYRAI